MVEEVREGEFKTAAESRIQRVLKVGKEPLRSPQFPE